METELAWHFVGHAFAHCAALSVAHLWNMPDIVRTYLETGDETLWAAASAAASADLHSAVATAAGYPEDKP